MGEAFGSAGFPSSFPYGTPALPPSYPYGSEGFGGDNQPFGTNTINVPETTNRQMPKRKSKIIPGGSIILQFKGQRPADKRILNLMTLQEFISEVYKGTYDNARDYGSNYFTDADAHPQNSFMHTDSLLRLAPDFITRAGICEEPTQSTIVNVAIGRVAKASAVFGSVAVGDQIYFGAYILAGLVSFFFVVQVPSMETLQEALDRTLDGIPAMAIPPGGVRPGRHTFAEHLIYIGKSMDNTPIPPERNLPQQAFVSRDYYQHRDLDKVNNEVDDLPRVRLYLDQKFQ